MSTEPKSGESGEKTDDEGKSRSAGKKKREKHCVLPAGVSGRRKTKLWASSGGRCGSRQRTGGQSSAPAQTLRWAGEARQVLRFKPNGGDLRAPFQDRWQSILRSPSAGVILGGAEGLSRPPRDEAPKGSLDSPEHRPTI